MPRLVVPMPVDASRATMTSAFVFPVVDEVIVTVDVGAIEAGAPNPDCPHALFAPEKTQAPKNVYVANFLIR